MLKLVNKVLSKSISLLSLYLGLFSMLPSIELRATKFIFGFDLKKIKIHKIENIFEKLCKVYAKLNSKFEKLYKV